MKRKKEKTDWSKVKWTSFEPATLPPDAPAYARPHAIFLNSIYQVSVWFEKVEPFGEYVHLSIKTLDRQPRHDWRELQRIKNELCGPESEGVELYPAESRLVDTANQYHLFVFREYKFPFGFKERLVAEGSSHGAVQRDFPKDAKPPDIVRSEAFDKMKADLDAKMKGQGNGS